MAKLRSESGKINIEKKDPNHETLGRVNDIRASDNLKAKVQQRVLRCRQDLCNDACSENQKESELKTGDYAIPSTYLRFACNILFSRGQCFSFVAM